MLHRVYRVFVLGLALTAASLASAQEDPCQRLNWDYFFTLGAEKQQVRRFLQPLREIAIATQSYKLGAMTAEELVTRGVRYPVMQLESLSALYETEWTAGMRAHFKIISEFSDILSHYTDAVVLRYLAQQVKAPPETQTLLAHREAEARRQTAEYLKAEKWLSTTQKNPFDGLRLALLEWGWQKAKADREFVRLRLLEELHELLETKFDMQDFEDGLHRFRRRFREVLIQMSSLSGLVIADATRPSKPEYQAATVDPRVLKKSYARFDPDLVIANPLRLSKSLLFKAVQVVEDLGVVKDIALSEEALADALVKSGEFKSSKKALAYAADLVKLYPNFAPPWPPSADMIKESKIRYKEARSEIIPRLIAELEAQAPK